MALAKDELRPYQALLVAQVDPESSLSADQVMKKLKDLLKVKVRDSGRKMVASGRAEDPSAAFVHYQDRRPVSWSLVPVLDRVNHLAVVVARGKWVAIHCTESSRRDTIVRALRKRKLGPMAPVRSGHLKAAFMKGPARTLWLRGTHKSTPYKADSKVLASRDLAPALDPLGDQSYHYTAARCEPDNPKIGDVMGLAVEQSRVWITQSEDWYDFAGVVSALFDALEETIGQSTEPLPVLAESQADLDEVEGAYDVAISPPEMMMIGPVQDAFGAQYLADMEKFAFGTQFEVTGSEDDTLSAHVLRRGEVLGELELRFEGEDGRLNTIATGVAAGGHEEAFAEVLEVVRDPEALTVYFESGHTIQEGKVFTIRHRDIPFSGWSWVDFGDYWSIDQEKPGGNIYEIGSGRSLFDWVLADWPAAVVPEGARGWLACDDRPGETADFLHIDDSGEVPTLTLIHVKAAKSDSDGRKIAVVPYETVAAQAIKNIRHLDAVLAAGELLGGTLPEGIELAAWFEGEQRSREEFIARLNALGSNFSRRVAIIQPHVRKGLVQEVRGNTNHAQAARLRQLDTLLHGVAANCQSAGADLVVVGAS
ncbi:MAG TPA: hypothetical protein VHR18_05790 [Solirubrobacterales bacterium]|jgi:hypothetical protein|nr:hypothetical protein [Solirubrobacterales bacterium]